MSSGQIAFQQCLRPACQATFSVEEPLAGCPRCGDLLDVQYDWNRAAPPSSLREFEAAWSQRNHPLEFSGVWRFRRLLPFAPDDAIVTIGEGQTILQNSPAVARYVGVNAGKLFLQHEGLNPSGSFKDNGMTAAVTHAHLTGARHAACASTGNTSASLAIFASSTSRFRAIVFVGSGKIAFGKLSQALDYGAKTLQIEGDFDDAMQQVQAVCREAGIYLCNSLNPFRLEGQKAIIFRVLESLQWEVPDWIVVPGGNLGNTSAFGKALIELKTLGLISRLPRLAVINASGASTLFQLYEQQGLRWQQGQVDDALIGRFYSALDACDGVVREVTDQEILDAKAQVGAGGFGCEPASAASVAGARKLRAEGVLAPSDRVVCILTGHQLKDPDATVGYHARPEGPFAAKMSDCGVHAAPHANAPVPVANRLDQILEVLRGI